MLYSALFFWKFWKNPYLNNTSEMATTFYPHWVWMGRQLKAGKLPLTDNIYFKYPACIPFLSTFYLPHLLTSITGSFRVLQWTVLSHYFLTSLLTYKLFLQWCQPEVALFGAITLAYAGYCIKIQQPCIAYTLAWIPGAFLPGWLGTVSMAMALYAGYYPILIYVLPFILINNWIHGGFYGSLLGIALALPQIVPFLWYYTKSVRWKSVSSYAHGFGRVTFRSLCQFFLPLRQRSHTNDVMFMEMQMYIGLLPFLFIWLSHSRFWFVLAAGLAIATGLLRPIQRIPARALYLVTLSLVILSTDGLSKICLSHAQLWMIVGLQAACLLFNRDIYPSFPFTQWWGKGHKLDYTGYLNGVSLHEYRGAFSIK